MYDEDRIGRDQVSGKSAKLRKNMEAIRSKWDLKKEYTPLLEETLREFAKR